MAFLDALAKAVGDALTGYQAFQYQILPALQERRLAELDRQYRFMMGLVGNDPQRAFQTFGDRYLETVKGLTGLDLPVREVPEVTTEEVTETVPKEEPSPLELQRAGEREQPFVPEVRTTVRQVPTGRTRRELALPQESAGPAIEIPGYGQITLGQLREVFGPAGAAQVFMRALGLEDPIQRARLALEIDRMALDRWYREERLRLERQMTESTVKNRDEALAVRKRLADIEEKRLRAMEDYNKARTALAQGNLQEAARHHRAMEAIARGQLEVARLRAARGREEEEGPDRATVRQILNEVRDAQARVAQLRRFQQELRRNPNAFFQIGNTLVDASNVDGLLAAAEAEAEERRQQLAGYRESTTVYRTRTRGTLTSAQIKALIQQYLARGATREQIRRALEQEGIPPARFGF
jgi:hypothetical protein